MIAFWQRIAAAKYALKHKESNDLHLAEKTMTPGLHLATDSSKHDPTFLQH